jgi:hypothetical protein
MTPPRSRLLLAFANTFGLVWAAPAGAQPPAAVMLHTSTCRPQDDAALRRALEVELQALHIEPRWASTDAVGAPAPITLSAECSADSDSVSLRVWASNPRLVLSRFVALRDVDEPARARTLALVISEALGPTLAIDRDDSAERAEPPPPPRRGSGFSRSDPYGDQGANELFTTRNPYGMPHTFRIGAAAQTRLAMRDSSVLLGAEVGASGPIADSVDASFEVSYSGTASGMSALPSSWWSVALGSDFVHFDAIGLAAGPRLSFGHLSITRNDSGGPTTERTLVAQLGLRSKFEVPVSERVSALLTFAAQHTFGVYALTDYTGLDEGLNGWVISWGLGLGVEP